MILSVFFARVAGCGPPGSWMGMADWFPVVEETYRPRQYGFKRGMLLRLRLHGPHARRPIPVATQHTSSSRPKLCTRTEGRMPLSTTQGNTTAAGLTRIA